jgi:hypothetical protein
MKKLVLLLVLGLVVSAQAGILVPNGDFETFLKPGTAITGVLSPAGNAWTQGVGPDCPIDVVGMTYQFADETSGTLADIPGWVGYDREGWIALGGTYDRDQTTGNLQGSVANQTSYSGLNCYIANGAGWSNAAGGLIVTDAPLARPAAGPYKASMMFKNPVGAGATPVVLDLLVDGVVVTPDASVDPVMSDQWQEMTRTYSTLPAGDITIVVGVGRNAEGNQSAMDDVSFVPEPATITLFGLGCLALLRRRR